MDEIGFYITRLSAADFPTRRMSAEVLGEFGDPAAIRPLLHLLGDDYWQVRNTVVDSLIKIRDRASIEPLIDCLRDEDPGVRNSAMSVLNEMGEDVVVPLSRLLLNDDSEDVRIFCANTLGRLRRPEAVGGLVKGLKDPDENVRYACAEGLGRLARAEAVPPLLEAMQKEETWSQFPYIAALGLIGDERACPALISLLEDEVLAFPAVIALGQIGDVSALYPITRIISQRGAEDSLIRASIVSLVQIGNKSEFLSKVEQCGLFYARALEVMRSLPPEVVIEPLLTMALKGDEGEVRAALKALRFIEGQFLAERLFPLLDDETMEEEVREILVRQGKGTVRAALTSLKMEESRMNTHLVTIVGLLGSEEDADALAHLLDSPSTAVVCDALKAIGMLNGTAWFEKMTGFLASENEQVRHAAIGGISLLKKKGEFLEKVVGLVRSNKELVRRGGYRVLGFISSIQTVEYLVEGLADDIAEVRASAVHSLGYVFAKNRSLLEEEEYVVALGRLLLDESADVRTETTLAFGRIHHPITDRFLLGLLEGGDREVQDHVIRAVGKCRIRQATPYLCHLLESMKNRTAVAIPLCNAVGQCGGPEVVPLLRPFMENETPELAAEAILAVITAGGAEMADSIVPYLQSDSWIVKNAALNALGMAGRVSAGAAVVKFLNVTEDSQAGRLLVRAALRALGKIGGRNEVGAVVSCLGLPWCQYEAFSALKAIWSRDRRSFPIREIPDPVARRLACSLAGAVDGETAEEDIAPCFTDEYPSVRRAAVAAFKSVCDSPERLSHEMKRASADEDFWVREIAGN